MSRVFPWHMAQKVVCFSLCYYVLLIWLLLWPLPCLRNQRFGAVQLAQGGRQCSDRRALCWGTPNKRSALGRCLRHRDLWLRSSGLPVAVRRPNPRKGMVGVRLLRSFTPPPSACALRLRAIRLGDDLALAVAFRTIFAKQSLVSTLQRSGPAELG